MNDRRIIDVSTEFMNHDVANEHVFYQKKYPINSIFV